MARPILLACLVVASVCGVSQLPTSASTPTPTIQSFSPISGNAGTKVIINGTNLAHASRVTFNGRSASIISDHAAKIKADVPRSATTGYIEVTTPGGTAKSASEFTVVLDYSSTSTTPASSSVALGYDNSDNAIVRGNLKRGSPTGTIMFYECGPTASAEPCTSQANRVGSPVALTAGTDNTASLAVAHVCGSPRR